LVSGKLGAPCCKLPIPLTICSTCGGGIKQTRGWTWIDPQRWLKGECVALRTFINCAAADPARLGERVGLLWIGERFYPTPDHFQIEAAQLGISRGITAIPRGFEIGKHRVFFAHPKVFTKTVTDDRGGTLNSRRASSAFSSPSDWKKSSPRAKPRTPRQWRN
jgi:hypothetical protein